MSQRQSLIALCLVGLLLTIGIVGWITGNSSLQLTFIVVPVILISFFGRVSLLKSDVRFFRLLYGKKAFEAGLQKAKSWTYKRHLVTFFCYGIIMLLVGLVFLYLYQRTSSITALLWGIACTGAAIGALIQGSFFREIDLVAGAKKREAAAKKARYFLMVLPLVVIGGMYPLSLFPLLQGDFLMENVAGIIFALMGIVSIPFAVWKVISARMASGEMEKVVPS